MKSLGRQIGWLTIGQSAIRGAQIVAFLSLIRLIDSDEWNSLALAFSVYFVGVTIGSLNLEHSVLAFLPRIELHHYRTFLIQTRRVLLVAAAITVSIVLLAQFTLRFMDGTWQTVLLSAAILLEIPAVIGGPVFIARGLHQAAGIWDLASALSFLLCLFVPAITFGSATSILVGLFVYSVVRSIGFAIVLHRIEGEQLEMPIGDLARKQLLFCAPLGISLALGTLTRTVDKWLVAWQLPHSIGAYTIAAQEIPLLAVLPYAGGAAVSTYLVHHLTNNNRVAAHTAWRQQAEMLCFPVVTLSVAIALLSPELLSVLLPHAPAGTAMSFAVFSLIGIHRVTEYGVVLRAANQNRKIVESAAIVLIGCVIFGFVGVNFAGLVGVSLGTSIAFAFGWIAILRQISFIFGLTIREVFPWITWLRALNSSVGALVGAILVSHFFESNVTRAVVKLITFVAIVQIVRWAGGDHKVVALTQGRSG